MLVCPADGNVRNLVDDSAGEVLDGHLELLCCGGEEVLADAMPELWQIGETAGDELGHEVLQEARDARAEDESRWMLMDCREDGCESGLTAMRRNVQDVIRDCARSGKTSTDCGEREGFQRD